MPWCTYQCLCALRASPSSSVFRPARAACVPAPSTRNTGDTAYDVRLALWWSSQVRLTSSKQPARSLQTPNRRSSNGKPRRRNSPHRLKSKHKKTWRCARGPKKQPRRAALSSFLLPSQERQLPCAIPKGQLPHLRRSAALRRAQAKHRPGTILRCAFVVRCAGLSRPARGKRSKQKKKKKKRKKKRKETGHGGKGACLERERGMTGPQATPL